MGTFEFLKLLNYSVNSFLDEQMMPLDRIYQIWYVIFVLNLWRDCITKSKKYTMDIFVTSNVYNCIELNSHGLINIICFLKEKGLNKICKPWLFSSQPCESFFQTLRSMTTPQNTIVNFTLRDVLFQIKRIDIQNEIKYKLSQRDYSFKKRNKGYSKVNEFVDITSIELPSKFEISETIAKAKNDVIDTAIFLGLITVCHNKFCFVVPFQLNRIVPNEIKNPNNDSETEEDEENNFDCTQHIEEKVQKDLIRIPGLTLLNIKSYENSNLKSAESNSTPFCRVKVTENGKLKEITIKKSTLCWLFSN